MSNTNYQIALRFLFSKKRAMLMSLSGIIFGVGLFVLTQAQTSGFQHFFIRTILGTDGAMRIQDRIQDTMATMEIQNANGGSSTLLAMNEHRKYIEGVRHPYGIKQALRAHDHVTGVSEILRGSVELDTHFRSTLIEVYGINLDEQLRVSNLDEHIIRGSLESFRESPRGLLVGAVIARRNGVRVGDYVILRKGTTSQRFRVSGIFQTGVDHVDRKRVFAHMSEARSVLQEPFGISYLQVALDDPSRAVEMAAHFESIFGHAVTPWQEREKVWLDVFHALRLSSAMTVSTIIIISGLGMFNTLAMIVMEKNKEIAILRSMGYTRGDISRIFLWQGFLVLIAGSLLGCLFAALSTWGVTQIPLRIRGVFSTDHFVVYWATSHYVYAVIAATVVVMIASIIPARRAARLEPGDIIRGTGG